MKEYVQRCFTACETEEDKDRTEKVLKEILQDRLKDGSAYTIDWTREPLPEYVSCSLGACLSYVRGFVKLCLFFSPGFAVLRLNSRAGKLSRPSEQQTARLAAGGKRQRRRRGAGAATGWDTTGIYFLRGVRLPVLPGPHLALLPRPAAATGSAVTKDTSAGGHALEGGAGGRRQGPTLESTCFCVWVGN